MNHSLKVSQKNDWRGKPVPVAETMEDDSRRDLKEKLEKLSNFCFPGTPVHFPLKKKIMLAKTTTFTGVTWENFQLFLAVASCILLVLDAYYYNRYGVMRVIYSLEITITQVFVADFALHTYLKTNPWSVLWEVTSVFDVITILPAFVLLIYPKDLRDGEFFVIYCLRLLRSVRIFKVLRKLTGKNKHIAMFGILLLCSSFFVAGSFYYLENMEYRRHNNCNHIGEETSWKPSCDGGSLVEAGEACDCSKCLPYYQYHDGEGTPGRVRCSHRTFFEAIYFTFVSGTAIGYGDIVALYSLSRLVVLVFIIATLIAVPIQINTLLTFMTSLSPFRAPYSGSNHECHVVICGHVNDKSKLEKFFKEFFHPDRLLTSTEEYHAVILGLGEPSEEVRSLLVSPMLDTRVTYVIGSALAVEDLKRARADTAVGMFFLSNTEVQQSSAAHEDAATVLRSLCVANFSPELRSLVQILRPEDKAILKDSDVDVILCLDEFKTALIARNAICPGFSTFIENMFHSFGNVSTELEESMDPWYTEYLHGARKEVYYGVMSELFLIAMDFSFRNITQAVYLEFGIVVLGVCDLETQDIVLNPTAKDLPTRPDGNVPMTFREFFQKHNVAVMLADDQLEADELVRAVADPVRISSILERMSTAEMSFKTKHYAFNQSEEPKKSTKTFKFIAKSIVAPLRKTAESARRRFSKHTRVDSITNAMAAYELRHSKIVKPSSFKDPTLGDDDSSSDDENEATYIGFKNGRSTSTLSSAVTGKSVIKQILAKKKKADLLKAASAAPSPDNATPGKPSAATEAVTVDVTQTGVATATVGEEAASTSKAAVGIAPSILPPVSSAVKLGNNQELDVLGKTISNDQLLKALKRKSEPPPENLKAENWDKGSLKRRSEPPPSTPDIEDAPVSSPIREKPGEIRGPPLAMASPHSPLVSGKFKSLPPLSSFAEEATTLDVGAVSEKRGSSTKLKPLSKKESSEKLSARRSAKLKKIKQQVRKSLIVVKSTKMGSEKRNDDGRVQAFARLESNATDVSQLSAEDPFEEEKDAETSPPACRDGNAAVAALQQSSQDNFVGSFESYSSLAQIPGKLAALPATADADCKEVTPEQPMSRQPSNKSMKMSNVVGTMMTIGKTIKKWTETFGKPSCEVESAQHLQNHIIVYGPDSSALTLFVSELRRPAIRKLDYHPILVVGKERPANWNAIANRYNDIYFLKGHLTKTSTFKKLNIKHVFSMVLFLFNEPGATKDATNTLNISNTPDAGALFMYLKLLQHIPDHVFFFVELKSSSNISVLNATIMRRLRERQGLSRYQKPSGPTSVSSPPPLLASLSSKLLGSIVHNDSSDSVKASDSMKASRKLDILETKRSERLFWDAMDTHHILPVFAAGKVYVPETFETLLVQSFYNAMTPIICDKLVCGQKGQAVMQAKLPDVVDGWPFLQLFRMFSQFQVVVFGLFRAPSPFNKATLPYVYICPTPATTLCAGDAVMVYARNAHLLKALTAAKRLSKTPKPI